MRRFGLLVAVALVGLLLGALVTGRPETVPNDLTASEIPPPTSSTTTTIATLPLTTTTTIAPTTHDHDDAHADDPDRDDDYDPQHGHDQHGGRFGHQHVNSSSRRLRGIVDDAAIDHHVVDAATPTGWQRLPRPS